jgi:ureidoglycolate lyase
VNYQTFDLLPAKDRTYGSHWIGESEPPILGGSNHVVSDVKNLMLAPKPLTRDDFLPFGEVIESAGRDAVPINFGHARRFHRLASVDCQAEQGEPVISIVTTKPWPSPIAIRMLERHPISTQAFIPLMEARFLVVVAERNSKPRPENIQAFVTNGRQGINYGRGTWHHPLLALSEVTFLVVDRAGPAPDFDQDYEEISLEESPITLAIDSVGN